MLVGVICGGRKRRVIGGDGVLRTKRVRHDRRSGGDDGSNEAGGVGLVEREEAISLQPTHHAPRTVIVPGHTGDRNVLPYSVSLQHLVGWDRDHLVHLQRIPFPQGNVARLGAEHQPTCIGRPDSNVHLDFVGFDQPFSKKSCTYPIRRTQSIAIRCHNVF